MGPFRVRLTAVYGRGLTDIDLPPLGRITANTHRGPLRFTATLQEVSVPDLTRDLSQEGPDGLVSAVQHDALASLGSYAAWAFVAAMVGAVALSLLVFRLRWRLVAVACVAALVAAGGSELSVWATFRPSAFLAPRYSGSLGLAPKLIGPVRTATGRIADFRAELEQVVDGAVRAYAAIPIASLANGAEIRVLHISDVHLNPLGLDFAREVAEGFDVNFVIDTGDLTSFGTPAEQLILSQIPAFRRPYLFVRGTTTRWRSRRPSRSCRTRESSTEPSFGSPDSTCMGWATSPSRRTRPLRSTTPRSLAWTGWPRREFCPT